MRTFTELEAFRAKAVEMGLPSLATAALIGWEWLQRERDIFATFDVTHYRPKERPIAVRVMHEKTREENWIPLFDDAGSPLYPELMAELDVIKRERIGGLMLRRDWGDQRPWPTWPIPDEIDLTHMSRKIKEVIRAAGLRDELTFTSFRHGGFTEAADADLSDAEIRAQGRHKSAQGAPEVRQADHEAGRRPGPRNGALCEQMADICQNEQQHACQNGMTTMSQVLENIGAGEGNRTLVISLEDISALHAHHALGSRSPCGPRIPRLHHKSDRGRRRTRTQAVASHRLPRPKGRCDEVDPSDPIDDPSAGRQSRRDRVRRRPPPVSGCASARAVCGRGFFSTGLAAGRPAALRSAMPAFCHWRRRERPRPIYMPRSGLAATLPARRRKADCAPPTRWRRRSPLIWSIRKRA